MDWRKLFFFIAVIFHFAIILSVCVASCIDGYISFYSKKPSVIASVLHAMASTMNDTKMANGYTLLAGIDAGYGFFAPNVSSGYLLEFTAYDSNGAIINRNRLPDFTHQESYIRYSSLLDAFQDKLTAADKLDEKQRIKVRRLNAIIKSTGTNILISHKATDKVEATLYLYHFPSLEAYRRGNKEPELLVIDHLIISTK